MGSLKSFKVGDWVKVLYELPNVTGKFGIVVNNDGNTIDTIIEQSGWHRWSKRTSLENCEEVSNIDVKDLKWRLKICYDKKKIDNLTYIELLNKLNESTKSKKSV